MLGKQLQENYLNFISFLGSDSTPVPKKRALMRQYFPDYRNLMEKDLKNSFGDIKSWKKIRKYN